MKIRVVLFGLILGGCEMGHLGNPILWPAYAIESVAENSIYGARRGKVKTYIAQNYSALINELKTSSGPVFNETARLATVEPARRSELYTQAKSDLTRLETSIAKNIELLTITFMVHGGS